MNEDFTFLPLEEQQRAKKVGIPRNRCKKCGYSWYAGYALHDFKQNQFTVVCPKCGASRRVAFVLTKEDGTPVKMWGKPSEVK